MTVLIKKFLLLSMGVALLNCGFDFSTELNPETLTDEDKIWLEDSDGDDRADSIYKYAPYCYNNDTCLKFAKAKKKEGIEKRIQNFLKQAEVNFKPPGGTYNEATQVIITSGGDGIIRYEKNGDSLSEQSPVYQTPIKLSTTTTLIARSFSDSVDTAGPIQSALYKLKVNTPRATLDSGKYSDRIKVALTCENENAEIFYTTDNSPPSTPYRDSLEIIKPTILKAVAVKPGWTQSDTLRVGYDVSIPDTVKAPVFNPPGGSYGRWQEVRITSETEGAGILYTHNGIPPDSSPRQYSEKFIRVDESMVIKAHAIKEGMKSSPVSEAVFTILPDSLGPDISLTNQLWKDTTVIAADVTIEVKVRDTSGVKSVTINGETASPEADKYSQNLTLRAGEQEILIMARDSSKNENEAVVTLKITYDPPPNPVKLFPPTHITGKGMRITWTQNDNSDFQFYKIFYSTRSSVSISDTPAGTATKFNTSYEIEGLQSNTTYYVKVFTFDNTSRTGSNEV